MWKTDLMTMVGSRCEYTRILFSNDLNYIFIDKVLQRIISAS